jgi:hypothetical protein
VKASKGLHSERPGTAASQADTAAGGAFSLSMPWCRPGPLGAELQSRSSFPCRPQAMPLDKGNLNLERVEAPGVRSGTGDVSEGRRFEERLTMTEASGTSTPT